MLIECTGQTTLASALAPCSGRYGKSRGTDKAAYTTTSGVTRARVIDQKPAVILD